MRLMRSVPINEWALAEALGDRIFGLIGGLGPEALLEAVASEAERAARADAVRLTWQESCDRPGFHRIVAQIPLLRSTFDQLLNGRSGYRAQFYLSPEEGVLYNRDLLLRILPAIEAAYRRNPIVVELSRVLQSLLAPHAKVWVYGEKKAFDEAAANTVNPPRWIQNGSTRGRKAPLPSRLTIDVKAAFLQAGTECLFVDELKLDRPMELFSKGWT